MENRKRDILIVAVLVILVTVLHYSTIARAWAIHDFYRRLYYIPILLGAFQFRLKGGVLVASIVSLFYLPHVLFLWGYENIGLINQLLEIAMFLFIGSIAGYLVEQLYRNNILLKEQLERITEMEILNENILNSMSNPLIALDRDQGVKIINHAAHEAFDRLELESSFSEEGHPLFRELHPRIDRVLKRHEAHVDEIMKVNNDGDHSVYQVKIYPLLHDRKDVQGVVILLEDITEVYHLEEEIRRADKLSAVGVMASGVAHEIRNPLGIVKTIAQTIKSSSELSPVHYEGLTIIINEVDRANDVIKEILNFSKIERGELVLAHLEEIVSDVVRIMRKFAEDNGVRIDMDIEEHLGCKMDLNKMKQVFMNLIMNAVDAMQDGGIVNISGGLRKDVVQIRVSDNGAGIPEGDLENIFNPFYTTKVEGTGLGLSITHKIIKEHNGSIQVNSTLGKGSTFTIELPCISEVDNES